jgi:hypothetical protein
VLVGGEHRLLRAGIAANLAALLLLAGYVVSQAYPSTEAVRLRNALLITRGTPTDFTWTQKQIPPTFIVEQHPPLPEFVSAARAAGIDSMTGDWEKALALAGVLTRNARDKGAIQSDLVTAYRGIVDEGRGYCADFTEVYLGLAVTAGLLAREWGFSFDGFGGHGHAVIEIFDREREKWVFLDVYNNVHAVDASTGEPLSALEFRDFALGRRPAPIIRPNGPGRRPYSIEGKLVEYYRRGAGEWYLWWGNGVFTYDSHPAVKTAGRLSRTLGQLAAIAVGVHPRIKVLTTAENARQLERMERLRWRLLASGALFAMLLVVLLVQLVLLVQRRRRQPVLRGAH